MGNGCGWRGENNGTQRGGSTASESGGDARPRQAPSVVVGEDRGGVDSGLPENGISDGGHASGRHDTRGVEFTGEVEAE